MWWRGWGRGTWFFEGNVAVVLPRVLGLLRSRWGLKV